MDPSSSLDLAALEQASVQSKPFGHITLSHFIKPDALAEAVRDFPDIADEASYTPAQLDMKPGFKAVIDALESERFSRLIEEKFDIDLGGRPKRYFIRKYVSSDHRIHTDNPLTQHLTVKIYFNQDAWTERGGPLLLLNGPDDVDDVAVEVEPARGSLTIFIPAQDTFHCNREFAGEVKQLQINWGPKAA